MNSLGFMIYHSDLVLYNVFCFIYVAFRKSISFFESKQKIIALTSNFKFSKSISDKPIMRDLSDKELVNEVCSNNQVAIVYFFYEKFASVFQYHIFKLFNYKVDVQEYIDEFFMYLHENNWHKLRTYDSDKATLGTWISVTSFRFFQNYKRSKIDSNGLISISDKWESFIGDWVESKDAGLKMDINNAISTIPNARDRQIAIKIFLQDKDFQEIAEEFALNVDYVYTVKSRLVKLLKAKLCNYR